MSREGRKAAALFQHRCRYSRGCSAALSRHKVAPTKASAGHEIGVSRKGESGRFGKIHQPHRAAEAGGQYCQVRKT